MNGLTECLVFRVPPGLRRRADKILRRRNAALPRGQRSVSFSDLGRIWLTSGLERDERELGLNGGQK